MGPLKRGKCFKWNYGNDVIIVWAGLMSLAAAAILNALHLRKNTSCSTPKRSEKAAGAFAAVLDTSHGALCAAKITAGLDTAVLCGFGSFGASTETQE